MIHRLQLNSTTNSASENGVPVPPIIVGMYQWMKQWLLGPDYVQRGCNAASMFADLRSAQHASTVVVLHDTVSRESPAISHGKATKK